MPLGAPSVTDDLAVSVASALPEVGIANDGATWWISARLMCARPCPASSRLVLEGGVGDACDEIEVALSGI
jgi:hypothetical protein